MTLIDLRDDHRTLFAACLEGGSDDVREAGDRRARWVERSLTKGLRAKLAINEHGAAGGMQGPYGSEREAIGSIAARRAARPRCSGVESRGSRLDHVWIPV
jgi:hypothetical protein